jgi:hypothetical protein
MENVLCGEIDNNLYHIKNRLCLLNSSRVVVSGYDPLDLDLCFIQAKTEMLQKGKADYVMRPKQKKEKKKTVVQPQQEDDEDEESNPAKKKGMKGNRLTRSLYVYLFSAYEEMIFWRINDLMHDDEKESECNPDSTVDFITLL